MKTSIILALSAIGSASAFSVSNKQQSIPKHAQKIASVAATIVTALTISANVATASPTDINMNMENNFHQQTSSILLSRGEASDPFAMPSYDGSIKNIKIEIDLDSVNNKIQADARAKREDKSVDKENNQASIDLRREEQEEDKRMEKMREYAKRERTEAIERERAESKANRWSTF
jgi:hypothetical protein